MTPTPSEAEQIAGDILIEIAYPPIGGTPWTFAEAQKRIATALTQAIEKERERCASIHDDEAERIRQSAGLMGLTMVQKHTMQMHVDAAAAIREEGRA